MAPSVIVSRAPPPPSATMVFLSRQNCCCPTNWGRQRETWPRIYPRTWRQVLWLVLTSQAPLELSGALCWHWYAASTASSFWFGVPTAGEEGIVHWKVLNKLVLITVSNMHRCEHFIPCSFLKDVKKFNYFPHLHGASWGKAPNAHKTWMGNRLKGSSFLCTHLPKSTNSSVMGLQNSFAI